MTFFKRQSNTLNWAEVRVGALALASRIHFKARFADSARVLALGGAGLAAVDDAGSADAALGVGDWLLGVHRGARLQAGLDRALRNEDSMRRFNMRRKAG